MNKFYLNITILLLFTINSFGQNYIIDASGKKISYNKIGDLYWTDNIKTTVMWSNHKELLQITKAPMPRKDYTGTLVIDQTSIKLFSSRVYINNSNNFYYTWNTANNTTSQKPISSIRFSPIDGKNINTNNSSICPKGWRIPNFEEISNLLISTNIFKSETQFNDWLSEGLYNPIFDNNPNLAISIKDKIIKSKLINKFLKYDEFAGMYGMLQGDPSQPLGKGNNLVIWLRNLGPTWSQDMQLDGCVFIVSRPKNDTNQLQISIKPEFSTEMASVKCVTDENGFKIYKEWYKLLKKRLEESSIIENNIINDIENNNLIKAYSDLEKNYKNNNINNEKGTELYKKWNDRFNTFLTSLIDNNQYDSALILLEFYKKKDLSIDKENERNQIDKWEIRIKNEKFTFNLDLLKQKPLNNIEKILVGKWFLKSKSIIINNELYIIEEIWIINEDRSYSYESRLKKFMEKTYLNEYKEKGVIGVTKSNFDDYDATAFVLEINQKTIKKIDKFKFKYIKQSKISRLLKLKNSNKVILLSGKRK